MGGKESKKITKRKFTDADLVYSFHKVTISCLGLSTLPICENGLVHTAYITQSLSSYKDPNLKKNYFPIDCQFLEKFRVYINGEKILFLVLFKLF